MQELLTFLVLKTQHGVSSLVWDHDLITYEFINNGIMYAFIAILMFIWFKWVLRHFPQIAKTNYSSIMSTHMDKFDSSWTHFKVIWYMSFFLQICRENSSCIEFWQESHLHYVQNWIHLLQYLAELYLES